MCVIVCLLLIIFSRLMLIDFAVILMMDKFQTLKLLLMLLIASNKFLKKQFFWCDVSMVFWLHRHTRFRWKWDMWLSMSMCGYMKCGRLNVIYLFCLYVHFTDFQTPLTPITPAARISALNIVGDLLRKLGVSLKLVVIRLNSWNCTKLMFSHFKHVSFINFTIIIGFLTF